MVVGWTGNTHSWVEACWGVGCWGGVSLLLSSKRCKLEAPGVLTVTQPFFKLNEKFKSNN